MSAKSDPALKSDQGVVETVGSVLGYFGLVWDGNDYLGQVLYGAEGENVFANLIRTVDGVIFGQLQDFLVDYLGSVKGKTNVTTGAIVNTYRYKPYGAKLSGGTVGLGFFWTGNTGSRSTGLKYAEQYNRARHYSSATRQWITRDLLWPSEHPYGYVGGNPVLYIDFLGLGITFNGCSKDQQNAIRTQLNGLSPLLIKFDVLTCLDKFTCSIGDKAGPNEDNLLGTCVSNVLKGDGLNLTISCCDDGERPCSTFLGPCSGDTCAVTIPGKEIVICGSYWDPQRCSDPPQCHLLHELIHLCGTPGHPAAKFECVDILPWCKQTGSKRGRNVK